MQNLTKPALILSVVSIVIGGCSADTLTAPSRQSAAPGELMFSKSVERPWKGECIVDAVFTSETTLLITGTCQLAHMGRTSMIAIQTISPTATGIDYTNTTTYTASNGDELQTTNVGVAVGSPTGLTLSGTETATGGTGRFANASGTASLEGAVQFTGPGTTTGYYKVNGRFEY